MVALLGHAVLLRGYDDQVSAPQVDPRWRTLSLDSYSIATVLIRSPADGGSSSRSAVAKSPGARTKGGGSCRVRGLDLLSPKHMAPCQPGQLSFSLLICMVSGGKGEWWGLWGKG